MTPCPIPRLSPTALCALPRSLSTLAVLALAACGGGGDSTPAAAPPPPAPAALTVGGTAATGAALAAAAVKVKCVGGEGAPTTNAEGVFTVAISGASLPCVLSVTSGSTTLRSVAEAGSATTVTANISTLSEIITARLAGGDAAALFTTFDAAAQAKLSSTGVATARAAVSTALQGAVDLTGIDPIKDALVAASPGKTGNALDQKLDALAAALKASGATTADVVAALVANPAAPAVVQTLLQPVASSCSKLRSGVYRVLDPGNTANPYGRVKINAVEMNYGDASGVGGTLPMLASPDDGSCVFTLNGGRTKAYVSAGGLIVLRDAPVGEPAGAALLIPEQAIPLAELAGSWNLGFWGRGSPDGIDSAAYGTQTFDATGRTTAGADCEYFQACVPWTPNASDVLVPQADGGFKQTDPDGSVARVFAVKFAAGQITVFGIISDRQNVPAALIMGTKATPLAMPAVGDVSKFWDMTLTSTGPSAVSSSQITVKSVDSVGQSYTRERLADGRIDAFAINTPQPGMRYRAAGTSATTNGATVKYGEVVALPLPGTGLTVTGSVGAANSSFSVSIIKP